MNRGRALKREYGRHKRAPSDNMSRVESVAASAAGAYQRRLKVVFLLTAVYLSVEVVGGILTGSLALLADAGHMFTDVAGLGLALLAIRFAARPASPDRTYGYHRAEILAALTNAVILVFVSLYVVYEAYQRFRNPPPVQGGAMLVVASIGLAVNVAGMLILRRGAGESLNLRGAYFEVLSDALTSIGVIVAAIVMITTGWYYADPIISAGIGFFILPRTWRLLRESVGVLLEGTPADVNLAAIREALATAPGVLSVHDLHVWSLTSGVNAMSAHVVIQDFTNPAATLTSLYDRMTPDLKLAHATIQLEPPGWEGRETHL